MNYDDVLSIGCRNQTSATHSTLQAHDPDFGTWEESTIELDHIKVGEIRTDLHERTTLHFRDSQLGDHVHHCMSLDGSMSANFLPHGMHASIDTSEYHNLYVPGHEYQLHVPMRMRNIHLAIEKDYYTSLLDDSEAWSASLKEKIVTGELFLNGAHALCMRMQRVAQEIFDNPLRGSLQSLWVEAKCHELIALQLEIMARQATGGTRQTTDVDIFYAIRAYLEENFLEPHSLQQIGRTFAINEFKLKKGFREHFQTTIFDYLLALRLNHARQLLLDTDCQVSEASVVVGYKNANHFSAAFKKMFGVSPSDIRNTSGRFYQPVAFQD